MNLNPFGRKAAPRVTLADLGKLGRDAAQESPIGDLTLPAITMTGADTDTDKESK
ncbi:hypothetical protein [Roseibium alexandrii]|uniref:Uncharacterized protein n=1 Tax=Roseibium alexandrii (strain DSM 17067 / NCIMB 14079 / DFL-11) TaxID=244592 RepID=A0A5E8H003_ROSAD|nr:hypothetical protein [Roseibium alexandrii]EEE45211.1 hypothetical protein SADFL11_2500 [Roseibium alexandrii DFL-11]